MILHKSNNNECRLYYIRSMCDQVGSIVINPCAFKKDKNIMAWKMLVCCSCKKKNIKEEYIKKIEELMKMRNKKQVRALVDRDVFKWYI